MRQEAEEAATGSNGGAATAAPRDGALTTLGTFWAGECRSAAEVIYLLEGERMAAAAAAGAPPS